MLFDTDINPISINFMIFLKHLKGANRKHEHRKKSVTNQLIVLFMMFLHLQSYAEAHGQYKITLQRKSISIAEFLHVLESQTNYRFVFNQQVLANKGNVNVNAKDESVTSLLHKVLSSKVYHSLKKRVT